MDAPTTNDERAPRISIGSSELPVVVIVDDGVEASNRSLLLDDGKHYDDEHPDPRPVDPFVAFMASGKNTYPTKPSTLEQGHRWYFGGFSERELTIDQARQAMPQFDSGTPLGDEPITAAELLAEKAEQCREWFAQRPHLEIRIMPGTEVLAINVGQPVLVDGAANLTATGCTFVAAIDTSLGAPNDLHIVDTFAATVLVQGKQQVYTRHVTDLDAVLAGVGPATKAVFSYTEMMNVYAKDAGVKIQNAIVAPKYVNLWVEGSTDAKITGQAEVVRIMGIAKSAMELMLSTPRGSATSKPRVSIVGEVDALLHDGSVDLVLEGTVGKAAIRSSGQVDTNNVTFRHPPLVRGDLTLDEFDHRLLEFDDHLIERMQQVLFSHPLYTAPPPGPDQKQIGDYLY